jgi:hypothetical protein
LREDSDAALVVDADSTLSGPVVQAISSRFAEGADAVQCRNVPAGSGNTLAARFAELCWLAANAVRFRGRAGLGLSVGLANGFAVTRRTLNTVPFQAFSIVEDLEYHLELVRHGRRADYVDSVVVRGPLPPDAQASANQHLRWEGGRLRMVIRWAPRLARDLLRGNWTVAEPLLDLLTLPLSLHLTAVAAVFLCGSPIPAAYASVALTALALHAGMAAAESDRPLAACKTLVAVPIYILWKLSLLPGQLRHSKTDAPWLRTRRGGEAR